MVAIQNFKEAHTKLSVHFPGLAVQGEDDNASTIHLYHAQNSVCSQKVRAVLFATGQSFTSHELNIFKGETYDPQYVRLRMMACLASGLPLATDHSGSTSASDAGCDACVVPMIALPMTEEVLIDSKNICIELDRRNHKAPSSLIPDALADNIRAEMSIVDNLPIFQLAVATGKMGPVDNSIALSKVRRCEALLAENGDDDLLRNAYSAKLAKEQAAANRLFHAGSLDQASQLTSEALRDLNTKLEEFDASYLFGSSISMADLFWGVGLVRMNEFGLSSIWSGGKLAALEAYYQRISQLPAVVKAFE